MKYFTVAGENRRLDAGTRERLRGSFIELSDGMTHYELGGPPHGPVAILVPGLTIPLFYWDDFARRLHARGMRTLAFSAYGRGYSDRVVSTYDEALFGRQLRELLTALNVPSPHHVVGTSMGALIALGYAAEHADDIATLTLVGPAGLGDDNTRRQRLLGSDRVATVVAKRFGRTILLGHLGHNVADPVLVEPLTEMIADTYRFEGSMYGFFSTLQNFALYRREALYRNVGERHIPTLLAWGTEDRVTPITGLSAARDLLEPARTEVLDCGHMAPYERPVDVADLLADFITTPTERNHHELDR